MVLNKKSRSPVLRCRRGGLTELGLGRTQAGRRTTSNGMTTPLNATTVLRTSVRTYTLELAGARQLSV